jgi:hypothetical protein
VGAIKKRALAHAIFRFGLTLIALFLGNCSLRCPTSSILAVVSFYPFGAERTLRFALLCGNWFTNQNGY